MKRILVIIVFMCFTAILRAQTPPVHVVLFTHIEDNTPVGLLGSSESRQQYTLLRTRLIALANLMRSYNIPWSFQPDWKILLAALQYEDAAAMQTTNGKNLLRYLKEDLKVVIDPHSHENGGYNYTDVAHLLDSLGVGGSTVIGGHIWDPSLLQFQNWDRFRMPVRGLQYQWVFWRGNILMGSGTPNHVNDPVISGVWRPRNRFQYFVDDPQGNIACVGQFKGNIAGVTELNELSAKGILPSDQMLTSSMHIQPATILQVNGLAIIEDSILKPLAALRSSGKVVLTDFTSLVTEWKMKYEAVAFLYDAKKPTATTLLQAELPDEPVLCQNYPNPFNPATTIRYVLPSAAHVKLTIKDILGRELVTILDGKQSAGWHAVQWDASRYSSGIYIYTLSAGSFRAAKRMALLR